MKLIKKESIPTQTCYDISVPIFNCFFVNGILVHNSNASIVLTKDDFYCQSREQVITPEKDNAGFARFVHELPLEAFKILRSNFNQEKVVIYGEWAGKGIQKGVAISQVDKAFFVFGARVISEDEKEEWLNIQGWNLPERFYNIYNFPTYQINIDFEKPEYALEQINKWVLEVEAECPVSKQFGISGIGEGIVFKPTSQEYNNSKFVWKAKGAAHASPQRKIHGLEINEEVKREILKFCDSNKSIQFEFEFKE